MYPLWVHNMSGGKVVWMEEHLAGTPVAPEWSAGACFLALKHWSRVGRHVSLMSQTQQMDTRSKDQGCAPSCSLYGLLYLFLATSILKGSWGMWLCIHKNTVLSLGQMTESKPVVFVRLSVLPKSAEQSAKSEQ